MAADAAAADFVYVGHSPLDVPTVTFPPRMSVKRNKIVNPISALTQP